MTGIEHHRVVSHALILLAGGLGRRFGGPKQLVEVGPAGEPLFAMTARSALDGGFDRVVVVTRTELEGRVEALTARHLAGAPVEIVLQDAVAPRRAQPWGTAHAVLVGAANERDAIGVANADDFYGGAALAVLAAAITDLDVLAAVVVTYPLGATLSANGPVNRAICEVDEFGTVTGIKECFGLEWVDQVVVDATGRFHDPADRVSMNLLGLGEGVLRRLEERFERFAVDHVGDALEMVLPDALATLLEDGMVSICSVPAGSRWGGLTHRADVDLLRRVVDEDAEASSTP